MELAIGPQDRGRSFNDDRSLRDVTAMARNYDSNRKNDTSGRGTIETLPLFIYAAGTLVK